MIHEMLHLETAKQILRDNGWCRGKYHNGATGQFCIMGALNKAGHDKSDELEDRVESNESCQRMLLRTITEKQYTHPDGRTYNVLESWNDHPDRTEEEVFETIDLTLERMKAMV